VSVKIHRGWHKAYIAIGSNMGEKEKYLQEAIAGLAEHEQIIVTQTSALITTEPYGGVEQDSFLNGMLEIKTLLTPHELLDYLHELEQKAGRERIVRWGPRTLDLDIVFYDKMIFEDDVLIIPHVDMENRDFVLKPMVELNPNFRHPILQKTMKQLLDALGM
jgi:dihydroneopterin aldolase/2-amino-4-hydroxy-6-hydroxymethyldihydropteridine diphosphokinase